MTFILFDRVYRRAAQLTHREDSQRDCTRTSETPVTEPEQVVSELELTKKRLERKHRELDLDRRIKNSILNHWLVIFMTTGGLALAVHAVGQRGLDMEPYILVLAFVGVVANLTTAFTASVRIESHVYYFLTFHVLEKDKHIRESKTSRQWKWFFLKHVWVPIGIIVCMNIVACLAMVFLTLRVYKDYGQGVVSMVASS